MAISYFVTLWFPNGLFLKESPSSILVNLLFYVKSIAGSSNFFTALLGQEFQSAIWNSKYLKPKEQLVVPRFLIK